MTGVPQNKTVLFAVVGIALGVTAGILIPKPNFVTEQQYRISLEACEQAKDRLLTGSVYD